LARIPQPFVHRLALDPVEMLIAKRAALLLQKLKDLPALRSEHRVADLAYGQPECRVVELRRIDTARQPSQVAAGILAEQVDRLLAGEILQSPLVAPNLSQSGGRLFLRRDGQPTDMDLLLHRGKCG